MSIETFAAAVGDAIEQADKTRLDPDNYEKAPHLDFSPEEQALFDLEVEHLSRVREIISPAKDKNVPDIAVVKMIIKSFGELFSPRHIRLLLNDAKLTKIHQKYYASKEGMDQWRKIRGGEDSFEQLKNNVDKKRDEFELAQQELQRAVDELEKSKQGNP